MYKALKRIIRAVLPAGVLYSLEPWLRRFIALFYAGRNVECPICGGEFRRFLQPARSHERDLLCPRCGSQPRKRLLWLFLENEIGIHAGRFRVLHFSPSRYVARRLRTLPNVDYTTSDIEGGWVDKRHDMTSIDEPDRSYDLIICYHVLEHIQDDSRAMSELHRILRPKGRAVLQVPYHDGPTLEDRSITDPETRRELFGREDHVRLYGMDDFVSRLRSAGFGVEPRSYTTELGNDTVRRCALHEDEVIFLCTKAH
jgi:hypothetical protein